MNEELPEQTVAVEGDWDGGPDAPTDPSHQDTDDAQASVAKEPKLRGKAGRRADEVRIVSTAVRSLTQYGLEVLTDRGVPGAEGVIEHVVVGNQGVHVVRSAQLKGRIRTTKNDIFIGGANCTILVNGLMARVDTVRHMVGGECNVAGAFCLTRLKFSQPTVFGTVTFGNTQALVEHLAREHRESKESLDLKKIAEALDGIFLPASVMS